MCGLTGVLCFDDADFKVSNSYLTKMRDVMIHRGPDSKGLWISKKKNVGLANRRLSIIDLSKLASQPMSNEDKSLWVSFNGEIYNHNEIKKELVKIGNYNWKTDHSDTEVVLRSFEEWGIDCIKKFRGMFAISIYDVAKEELWLIRDRIGIKPLYYSIHNKRITFASEIKALLEDPLQIRKVDEKSFYNYLSFLTTPSPNTLFKGIKKLSPGSWIKINHKGEMIKKKYWDVLDHVKLLNNCSEDEIALKIKKELKKSIKMRNLADVDVGIFLSGGIDSSAIACFLANNEKNKIKTFSVSYDKDYSTYKDEIYYAKKVATFINADFNIAKLDVNDLLNFLPDMIKFQDEPIADPVCVPIFYLSKLARENNIKVCQVGEGSDEIFLGYSGWSKLKKLQSLGESFPFNFIKKKLVNILKKIPKINYSFQLEILRRSSLSIPLFWGGAEGFSEIHKKHLISRRLRKKFKNYSSWNVIKPIKNQFDKKSLDKSTLNWMTYLDLNLRLPELLLMRVDKMSMASSLEARVPFLDHKLVELTLSIPEKIKIKNNNLKYILKKSLSGLIPDEIINRKKQGFNVPVQDWFLDGYGDFVKNEILKFCDETDFFNKSEIIKLINNGRGFQIWYILNFVLWWKEFIK